MTWVWSDHQPDFMTIKNIWWPLVLVGLVIMFINHHQPLLLRWLRWNPLLTSDLDCENDIFLCFATCLIFINQCFSKQNRDWSNLFWSPIPFSGHNLSNPAARARPRPRQVLLQVSPFAFNMGICRVEVSQVIFNIVSLSVDMFRSLVRTDYWLL